MKKKTVIILSASLLAVVSLFGLVLMGCGTSASSGGGGSSTHGTYSYFGTQSPGDAWSWTIGNGWFIGTNETTVPPVYYRGTFTTMASGFLKATVSDSNDTPAIGGTAIVLEYPNTLLLVKPGDDRVIICAGKATTPPPAGDYPWVTIPNHSWAKTGETSYGKTTVTVSNGLYTFEVITRDSADSNLGTQITGEYTFVNGRLVKAGDPMEIFMTPSGIFIGDQGSGEGGFAGATKEVVNIADAVNRNYRGVQFKYYPDTGTGETEPIGAEPHLPTALRGFGYEDMASLESNTYSLGPTLEMYTQDPTTGIVTGEMFHDHGYVMPFRMVVSRVNTNDKYIVFGLSYNDEGSPYSFLAVEQ